MESLFDLFYLFCQCINLLDHLSVISLVLLPNLLHLVVVTLLHRVHVFIFFFYLLLEVSFGVSELVCGLDHSMEVLALFQI